MKSEGDEFLKRVCDHFGIDNQTCMLMEECGELIATVNHWKRGRVKPEIMFGEMADVMIVIYQIILWLNGENEFEKIYVNKLHALKEKIK